MTKNAGNNHRRAAFKGRTQTYVPKNNSCANRNSKTGIFMDVKSDKKPFKGVTKED